MDEEKKELTVYDSEAQILEQISQTTDPEELAKLAAALEKVHNCIFKEMSEASNFEIEGRKIEVEGRKIEIEDQKIKVEKARNKWQLVGTIVAALLGATGVVGAQMVKGEMDSRYQDEGYAHEKTESIIWNKNRHKR